MVVAYEEASKFLVKFVGEVTCGGRGGASPKRPLPLLFNFELNFNHLGRKKPGFDRACL